MVAVILSKPVRSLSSESFISCLLTQSFDQLFSASALCKARKKINVVFFQHLFDIIASMPSFSKKWKGYFVYAIDGCKVKISNNKDCIDQFGVNSNQHSNQAMLLLVAKFNVFSKFFRSFIPKNVNTNERDFALEMLINEDQKKKILLYDRGFGSFFFIHQHLISSSDFIIRVHARFNKALMDFLKTDKNDGIITLKITDNARNYYKKNELELPTQDEMKVRVIRYKIEGKNNDKDYILLTSLDHKAASINDLKYLYSKRWTIETAFGILKNSLYLEVPSGNPPQIILQDLYAAFILFNISAHIHIENQAKIKAISAQRKYEYQVCYQSLISSIRFCIHQLLNPKFYKKTLNFINQFILSNLSPIRPNRSYKRRQTTRGSNSRYHPSPNFKFN